MTAREINEKASGEGVWATCAVHLLGEPGGAEQDVEKSTWVVVGEFGGWSWSAVAWVSEGLAGLASEMDTVFARAHARSWQAHEWKVTSLLKAQPTLNFIASSHYVMAHWSLRVVTDVAVARAASYLGPAGGAVPALGRRDLRLDGPELGVRAGWV